MEQGSPIEKRRQQVLYDKKWRTLLRRAWLFKYIPFVDFVFAAGSIAIGNVRENSDLDVLIGVRKGRIFTARLFAVAFFSLGGWRRSKADHAVSAKDKICLNHFITPATYALHLEVNEFWRLFYRSLVPLYGTPEVIDAFYSANKAWLPDGRYKEDMRHRHVYPVGVRTLLERVLAGRIGDALERLAKRIQVRRIEKNKGESFPVKRSERIPYGEGEGVTEYTLPPLIIYNDEELQFHPNEAHLIVRHR